MPKSLSPPIARNYGLYLSSNQQKKKKKAKWLLFPKFLGLGITNMSFFFLNSNVTTCEKSESNSNSLLKRDQVILLNYKALDI